MLKVFSLPTIYKKSSLGKIEQWSIAVFATSSHGDNATITTTYGEMGGKMQETSDAIKEGKNLGKKNETTALEQAVSEATSKFEKKLKSGYVRTLEDATSGEVDEIIEGGISPMLAHSYSKSGEKIKFPCAAQPKLDGCVHGSTKLTTNLGVLTIREIVEGRIECNVLSYNEKTGEEEFKPVINWFNNGEAPYQDWIYLKLSKTQIVKCTSNHKIYTDSGWKRADELDPKKDKVLADRGSDRLFGLLLGTILGDACILWERRSNSTSYRVSISHSNSDILDHKIEIFGLGGGKSTRTSGYGSKIFYYNTPALTSTDFPIEGVVYTEGELRGKRKPLDSDFLCKYLSDEGLALWIVDDGSLARNNGNKNTPLLNLHTEGYSEEDIQAMLEFFKRRYNCSPNLNRNKKVSDGSGIFLTFNTRDTLYLLNILREYHVRGAEYKFYFPTDKYIPTVASEYSFREFSVCKSRRNSPQTKYDIEVEGSHNYFANKVLVHNCRMVAIKQGDSVTLWTRTRKRITSCPHIERAVAEMFSDIEDIIVDGEAYSHEYKSDFEKIVSAVRKEEPTEDALKVQYHIYDVVDENKSFEQRREIISGRDPSEYVRFVTTFQVHTEDEVMDCFEACVANGYEGMMLRNWDSKYEFKRSYGLQKVKEFEDSEFEIVGVEEGRGKLSGLVGAFVCKTSDGQEFRAKPAGDQEATKAYIQNPESAIGKLLTVKYQGLTKYGIPRFPVGLRLREWGL